MIHWLRSPCRSCKFAQNISRPALHLPVPLDRPHSHPGHIGKLFTSRLCGIKAQARAGRDTLLNGVPVEYKDDVARIVEQAERAAETSWTTIHTGECLYTLLNLNITSGYRSKLAKVLWSSQGLTSHLNVQTSTRLLLCRMPC